MSLYPDVAIEIPAALREQLVDHARDGRPEEVCGVLGGEFDERTSRVKTAYPATNVATPPESRYEIDPEQQYAIFEAIEDRGEEIVGFYHSHPAGPPGPSRTDAAQATWPERSYVIVILGGSDGEDGDEDDPLVGSWRWTDDGFRREDLRIVG